MWRIDSRGTTGGGNGSKGSCWEVIGLVQVRESCGLDWSGGGGSRDGGNALSVWIPAWHDMQGKGL